MFQKRQWRHLIKMSRNQKDLEYIGNDDVHCEGFVIRVKNDEAIELLDTDKWKMIEDLGKAQLKRQGKKG